MTKLEYYNKISEYEAQRDFNLSIHCPLVAAKFQRYIDKLKKEYEQEKKE